jgi:hypothetical protein
MFVKMSDLFQIKNIRLYCYICEKEITKKDIYLLNTDYIKSNSFYYFSHNNSCKRPFIKRFKANINYTLYKIKSKVLLLTNLD